MQKMSLNVWGNAKPPVSQTREPQQSVRLVINKTIIIYRQRFLVVMIETALCGLIHICWDGGWCCH